MSRDDSGFISQALPAFIAEARDQATGIEQLLLQLEDAPGDRELLDALFRCAHTVKGSAGIFGLDDVVEFTHHVETLLDRLREGRLTLTPTLNTLLLSCHDEIVRLIDIAEAGGAAGEPAIAERALLVERLKAAAGVGVGGGSAGTAAAVPPEAHAAADATRRWHLSVRFGADTFRNGMDPVAILGYLGTFGRLATVVCDRDAVPTLDQLNPEDCHLSYAVALDTAAPRSQIESAFSFVRDDADLHLIEPDAGETEFVRLIEALPDQPRLGEILVAVGAIRREDLDESLRRQQQALARGADRPLIGQVLHEVAGVATQVVDAAVARQRQRDGAPQAVTEDQRLIRVQADRLDAVINLVGELVIASAGASLLAGQSGQAALVEANGEIGRLVEEIRNGALQLRMVPIGDTFARFRRVVRDTAAQLGLDVHLDISGGETELDKSMVERIADPLMHLVRNALDHGLETPDERAAAGKARTGQVALSACHESGSIVIRIVDDGRGIQRRKVLERAWERGLVERGVTPADGAILDLIFEPGFSTAEQVTNLSGRGVGMDVVRRNIQALRGSVQISSVEGAGSTIEIRMPLTLAIIDGFLVSVGHAKFVFPLDVVLEVIENRPQPNPADVRGRGVIELRGEVLPVVDLRRLYQLDSPEPPRGSIVVIQSGSQRYGVRVDALLGQQQTVIKPLGRMFRSLRGMSGSSILGNGEVALIFDAASLAQLASESIPRGAAPGLTQRAPEGLVS